MKLLQGKKLLLSAFLLFSAVSHCASHRNNNSAVCRPVNTTIAAEKDDCPVCMPITTSICSGYCETGVREYERLWKNIHASFDQRVCTYKELRYETVLLRGCPPGVNPAFTYPVAVSCHCDLCKTDSSDCTFRSTGPDSCSNRASVAQ